MEQLKHECGIVMIRLRKPLDFYRRKYGTLAYGLEKLYLMMEKQHNRGQEGAGIGVVNLDSLPGHEYVWRERALGSGAIREIFDNVFPAVENATDSADTPFIGQIYMGHLRYSTTGKSGISYVHPFLRRNNWRSRNLLMCGNFNMTNVDEVFGKVVARGQHPRLYSDTIVLLEQLGDALDKENHRLYRQFRDTLQDPHLAIAIEDNIDMRRILKLTSPEWDGGYAICGATGSGTGFVLRDSHGIRPAFYYVDEEIAVVASERPVIQTVMHVDIDKVKELQPGEAIIMEKNGDVEVSQILEPEEDTRCSFERIYFSRGSDRDIYRERKALGSNLAQKVLERAGGIDNLDNIVFSFIPNTAEVAFYGLVEELERLLDTDRAGRLMRLEKESALTPEAIQAVMARKVRVEKVVIKDVKLRTFITEGSARNDLAAHVYDVTYGSLRPGVDNLVVIDDSVVRGTTLRRSILEMISRLNPRKVVVVSSSPQVRYPDYYGIDMSRLDEFIAFHAAIALLQDRGMEEVIHETYRQCKEAAGTPAECSVNFAKAIYAPFTQEEISRKISHMVNPGNMDVEVVYQSIEGLHKAVPDHPGDWYFSGNYPTPGGYRLCNKAFVSFYEEKWMNR